MITLYYYIYEFKTVINKKTKKQTTQKFPKITVCLLHDPETNITSRGFTVCSDIEIPCFISKKEGRKKARARAKEANGAKKDNYPVVQSNILNILDRINAPDFCYWYKSTYDCSLTSFESTLIKKAVGVKTNGI